ncbi:MAG: ROK family protein [Candidatus Dormibacteraeota bacterium]|nr:ROK family protein [Candidatus Dormibacteraeota bacterium]
MIAGIDLGGTQVRVAVAPSDGQITGSARTATVGLGGPEGMVAWVKAQTDRLRSEKALKSVGVGAPGPIDLRQGRLVNPPNLPGWRDVPLVAMLTEALGCPAHLENDANLAGLAEFRRGAGAGTRSMVFITWSTGVGAALIVDGKLFSGAHGTAGEVGHMILDPTGPLDQCGQRGCVEAFCGGAALARQTGEPAERIFQEAAAGDKEAGMRVTRAATYMGQALVNVTNLLDPEVIVIGGGVASSWSQVEPVLRSVLEASPFIKPERRPRLRRARLGGSAGQVGAVEWARENL